MRLLKLGSLLMICSVLTAQRTDFGARLSSAALERITHHVRYDPAYVRIPYPGGDVPSDTGVCTDEIIRIYRAVGIDLQKLVHEDMLSDRSAYPRSLRTSLWGTDTNIDHRRVPNLAVFFRRHGQVLPTSTREQDYAPGDIVTWKLPNGLDHIGMVVDRKTLLAGRYMIVHNIGEGPKLEDVLFAWKISGHFRYPAK